MFIAGLNGVNANLYINTDLITHFEIVSEKDFKNCPTGYAYCLYACAGGQKILFGVYSKYTYAEQAIRAFDEEGEILRKTHEVDPEASEFTFGYFD